MTDRDNFTAQNPLLIGTRQSPLAMAQARMVAGNIIFVHNLAEGSVKLVPILSGGDKVQDRPLAEIGGKALWTKELERAMVADEIHIAVHSMKDVETVRSGIFEIMAMLPRADIRDRLIGGEDIAALPKGATIGTSSPRRAAQLLHLRPDLKITSIRGNVATRIAKIEAGEADATLLAAAGLDRLGMPDTGAAIEISQMLPAASQGAIGIDCLSENEKIRALLAPLNDAMTFAAVMAERQFLEALGGDCHSPVAAYARPIETDDAQPSLKLSGEIYASDGSERHSGEIEMVMGDMAAPAALAKKLLATSSNAIKALFTP